MVIRVFMVIRDDISRGFILPVTLWVIAAVSLAVASMSEWVASSLVTAIFVKNRMEADIELANIENELVFAFAKHPYTYRGLQVGTRQDTDTSDTNYDTMLRSNFVSDKMIFLDSRQYKIGKDKNYIIKIQDGRGLINLNTINEKFLGRLFNQLEVPNNLHSLLADTLLDYRDTDNLKRLSGAEKKDYARLKKHPPTNNPLLSPWEAQRIIGWNNLPPLWKTQYSQPLITTCRTSGFNPNTAPKEVLAIFMNKVTIEQTSNIINFREKIPIKNIADLNSASGTLQEGDPFFFNFVPGRCFIIELINPDKQQQIRFSLTLLPRNESQPWQIDYAIRIPKQYQNQAYREEQAVPFPSPEEIDGWSTAN